MRSTADLDPIDELTCCRIEAVDLPVVSARDPEKLPVGGNATHVRRPATGDRPLIDEFAGLKVKDRDCALSAVGDVEAGCVPAGIKPVASLTRGEELQHLKAVPVEDVDTVLHHVGDKKSLAVWTDPRVLGHAATLEPEGANYRKIHHVHLDDFA